MAVSADQTILTTEEEEVERYQELAFEVKEIPQSPESGSNTHLRMQRFGMENKVCLTFLEIGNAQLSAILGTHHMMWKVLCLLAAGSCREMAEKTQKTPETEENRTIITMKRYNRL